MPSNLKHSEKRRASWRKYNNRQDVRERKVKAQHERYQTDPAFAETMRANARRAYDTPEKRQRCNETARDYRKINGVRIDEQRRINDQKNPIPRMISRTRARAKVKGVEFSISAKDLEPLPELCPVFGFPLIYHATPEFKFQSASLDRIDNSKGYVPRNVIVVSLKANTMKNNATIDELQRLAQFYGELSGRLS